MKIKNKITRDGYIWLIVTEKAEEVFESGLFSVFALYDDESEALIESEEELQEAMKHRLDIGIEVGFIAQNVDMFEDVKREETKDK